MNGKSKVKNTISMRTERVRAIVLGFTTFLQLRYCH